MKWAAVLGSVVALLALGALAAPFIHKGEKTAAGKLREVVGVNFAGQRLPSCTGTLVAADMVVTAAHCVCRKPTVDDRNAYRRPTDVYVGDDPGRRVAGSYYPVAEYRVALACGVQTSVEGTDVAVLRLKAAVRDVVPARFATSQILNEAITFRVAGYGAQGANGGRSDHHKREAVVNSLTKNCTGPGEELRLGCQPARELAAVGKKSAPDLTTGADTCVGDSGGPLFVTTEGTAGRPSQAGLLLAGVTSRSVKGSRTLCGSGGIYERLDGSTLVWVREAMASMAGA